MMPEKDAFAEREKALEEEYFRRKEQELIEKMRRRAELEAERKQLAEATGIADQAVLECLQELGYTRQSVMLLHLVPLIQVAWADDLVAERERQLIYELARSRGIEPDSTAYQQLTDWLDHKPSEAFFEKTLRVIGVILQGLPEEKRTAVKQDLISYCTQVASVSGGILGLGKMSDEEKAALKRITAELEHTHGAAVKEVLKKG